MSTVASLQCDSNCAVSPERGRESPESNASDLIAWLRNIQSMGLSTGQRAR